MAQKKSTRKRVTRAAKTAVKKTRSAVTKVRKRVNVRATTARARKLGDAAIVAGAIIKQTADAIDTVAQAAASRKKAASRSRKSAKK